MEAFIIDAAEKGSGRIAELADTAIRDRGFGILAIPAAISSADLPNQLYLPPFVSYRTGRETGRWRHPSS